MENKPIVSVCMITHNHEAFIMQAIESVLMQKTDFLIELVIGEDFSADQTRQICLEYQQKYPEVIRVLPRDKNLGMIANFVDTLKNCKAKYIALCEGDDYWTDPLKVQKQVDFLEANSDYVICFHDVGMLRADNTFQPHLLFGKQAEISTFENLAETNFIPTVSCVFRNNLFKEFPAWFIDMPLGDWILHLINAQFGKIKYLNEVMAVYRLHNNGIWSGQAEEKRLLSWIRTVKKCRDYFHPRGKSDFSKGLANSYARLCFISIEEQNYKKFRQYYKEGFQVIQYYKTRLLVALTLRYGLSWFPSLISIYQNTARKIKKSADA